MRSSEHLCGIPVLSYPSPVVRCDALLLWRPLVGGRLAEEMNDWGFPPNRILLQCWDGSWLKPNDVAIGNRPRLQRGGGGRGKALEIDRPEDTHDWHCGQRRVIDHDLAPVVAIDLGHRCLQGFPVEGYQTLAPSKLSVRFGWRDGFNFGRARA